MKRSYTGTLFHPVLTDAVITIYESRKVKYESKREDFIKKTYTDVASWDIIEGGVEAEAFDKDMIDAGFGADENHEYLVLHFFEVDSKEMVIFKNSHVNMFVD